MTIETLGIDIAKTVFHLHGVNRNGRVVLRRRVMRDQLLHVIAQIEPPPPARWARVTVDMSRCRLACGPTIG